MLHLVNECLTKEVLLLLYYNLRSLASTIVHRQISAYINAFYMLFLVLNDVVILIFDGRQILYFDSIHSNQMLECRQFKSV